MFAFREKGFVIIYVISLRIYYEVKVLASFNEGVMLINFLQLLFLFHMSINTFFTCTFLLITMFLFDFLYCQAACGFVSNIPN